MKSIRVLSIFVIFQVLFIALQLFLFYPCFTSPVGDDLLLNSHHRNSDDGPASRLLDVTQRVENTNRQRLRFTSHDDDLQFLSEQSLNKGKYSSNWESLDSRPVPKWFDEAKIGIFLHWGVYSVPSYIGTDVNNALSEWFWFYWKSQDHKGPVDGNAKDGYEGFVERRKGAINSVQKYMDDHYSKDWAYTDFAPQFKAELFDAKYWASLFKKAGAKYVVLTSKHHDGYTLWPSRKSWNWNSMDVGPHRDIVGELGDAVKKEGLHYGLYHSLLEWFNPLYVEDKLNNFSTQVYVKSKLMPELYELVTKYEPEIVWADGEWEATCDYFKCKEFFSWLYNSSPVKDTVVTNDRFGMDVRCHHGTSLTCSDRYLPTNVQRKKWENCMTIDKQSWGYRRNAKIEDYYTMEELLTLLAQTVSNGGNMLMNIGPTSDGRIAPIFEERLHQLGDWLSVNGEAIYSTHPWHTIQDPNNKNVYYTKREGKIYLILTRTWPKSNKLIVNAPKPGPETVVEWLGFKGEISYEADNIQMTINLPLVSLSDIPCHWAWVFKLKNLRNYQA